MISRLLHHTEKMCNPFPRAKKNAHRERLSEGRKTPSKRSKAVGRAGKVDTGSR